MLLLFTLIPKSTLSKNKLLLRYNTETDKGELIGSLNLTTGIQTSGIAYSGANLCIGVQNDVLKDSLVVLDIHDDRSASFILKQSKDICDIISIYPGKLYAGSKGTNSIISIDFDPITYNKCEDDVHYVLNKDINYEIRSVYNYKTMWFVASKFLKRIFDLSNNRVVFSDIDDPRCIFFNSNHRLCFIERGKRLFHCGDDIFLVGDNPTTAIEDINKGGYWIVCGTELHFVDYEGYLSELRDLSKWGKQFNNIIEAKGRFANETI